MTVAQIRAAFWLCNRLSDTDIVDMREMGSEGCVLRTVVPGPLRGPGTWLIARDGVAQSYEGETRNLGR